MLAVNYIKPQLVTDFPGEAGRPVAPQQPVHGADASPTVQKCPRGHVAFLKDLDGICPKLRNFWNESPWFGVLQISQCFPKGEFLWLVWFEQIDYLYSIDIE